MNSYEIEKQFDQVHLAGALVTREIYATAFRDIGMQLTPCFSAHPEHEMQYLRNIMKEINQTAEFALIQQSRMEDDDSSEENKTRYYVQRINAVMMSAFELICAWVYHSGDDDTIPDDDIVTEALAECEKILDKCEEELRKVEYNQRELLHDMEYMLERDMPENDNDNNKPAKSH